MVAIVLAAGSARRLGSPKQRLPLGETTLLGWVLADLAAARVERIVCVCDAATAHELAPPQGRAVEIAVPPAGDGGCLHSIRTGLGAAGDCDAVMLALGDMPGVSADVFDALLERWRRDRPWAIATAYANGLGHPLVFSAEAFAELRGLHGDRAVWKLIERSPERVARVEVATARPLDVDTWDDYERVVAALAPETVKPPRPG